MAYLPAAVLYFDHVKRAMSLRRLAMSKDTFHRPRTIGVIALVAALSFGLVGAQMTQALQPASNTSANMATWNAQGSLRSRLLRCRRMQSCKARVALRWTRSVTASRLRASRNMLTSRRSHPTLTTSQHPGAPTDAAIRHGAQTGRN